MSKTSKLQDPSHAQPPLSLDLENGHKEDSKDEQHDPQTAEERQAIEAVLIEIAMDKDLATFEDVNKLEEYREKQIKIEKKYKESYIYPRVYKILSAIARNQYLLVLTMFITIFIWIAVWTARVQKIEYGGVAKILLSMFFGILVDGMVVVIRVMDKSCQNHKVVMWLPHLYHWGVMFICGISGIVAVLVLRTSEHDSFLLGDLILLAIWIGFFVACSVSLWEKPSEDSLCIVGYCICMNPFGFVIIFMSLIPVGTVYSCYCIRQQFRALMLGRRNLCSYCGEDGRLCKHSYINRKRKEDEQNDQQENKGKEEKKQETENQKLALAAAESLNNSIQKKKQGNHPNESLNLSRGFSDQSPSQHPPISLHHQPQSANDTNQIFLNPENAYDDPQEEQPSQPSQPNQPSHPKEGP
ncbi:unnamed protein product [Moneuplotes crassus]|uniref:Transmembrane protein n=1 Tax=Euplotes crassus TaxID=5936 RepID=A0AAD1X8G2_EUPCR|nr:unnamed protein product [Moneuplotes crassus]